MRSTARPAVPFVAGTALGALAVVALAARPAPPVDYEYRILSNPTEKDVADVTDEGWEYVGFLGQSTRGPSIDQSLWRRPEK
jgi:hypothetical protein